MRNKVKALILVSIFLMTFIVGTLINSDSIGIDISSKYLPPSIEHFFGTDWMGRDMFLRTIKGLSLSISIGIGVSLISGFIAGFLGVVSGLLGGIVDKGITLLIDLFLSIPSTIVIILISLALGGGMRGVVVGISITHWPSLARIIRGEVIGIKKSEFVMISRNLGKSNFFIGVNHILPNILKQIIIGTLALFPHAIIHEASISFLGFGLQPHTPSIGIILSESMKYLSSGSWWLTILPGIALISTSLLLDGIGRCLLTSIYPEDNFRQEV